MTTIDETELPITWRNRKVVVERKLSEFGSKNLIVTDRLHGAIFSFVTGTPCIALPNTNGKVERISRFLSGYGNVRFTNTTDDLTFEFDVRNESVKDRFGDLVDAIKNVII